MFVGLAAYDDFDQMKNRLNDNLGMEFKQDCSNRLNKVDFPSVFAVLFSGIACIETGANMSGELKHPGKSIPSGTLWGCLGAALLFVVEICLIALTCDRSLLYNACFFLEAFTFSPIILAIGTFCLTFSSSLSCLMGSSQILEAMAKDTLYGPFLAYVTKGTRNENPIAALLTSWCLTELILLLGDFNSIAQLSSSLGLLNYASVNIACLGLDLAAAPNFRPHFKYFSWQTSLIGALGSTIMMFLISPLYSAVSILLCLSLVLALNLFSPIRNENWGSISQALLFHQVRKYLLLLDPRKAHVKFWRPQILLLVQNPRTSCSLIDFVNALKKGGLYVLGHVYVDNIDELYFDPCAMVHSSWLSLVDHLC